MTLPDKEPFAYVDKDGEEWCVYSGADDKYLLSSSDKEDVARFLCREANDAVRSLQAKAELCDRMAEALVQALEHIEGDEATHGREFSCGEVCRKALASYDAISKEAGNGK